ncbi:MAG: MBL fold metallo-hydrolase [Terricaulis silvestris]
MRRMVGAALAMAALAQAAWAQSAGPQPAVAAAPPRAVAAGVTLLPGDFPPDRGPDGNTVIFTAPEGLVVIDTGRHVWHSDAILAYAAAQHRPIAAIINSHWHLDHTSGNGRLKAAFPQARVYATNAIDRALAPDGFLTRNLAGAQARLSAPDTDATEKEETQIFLDTMAHAQALRPDVVVTQSGPMRFAGRSLDVHVTDGAVTDADIWLYDKHTHVAVVGDLVTLPAPFFETACPQRWSEALDAVWATPFVTAIPGHGDPMTRTQFDTYRHAYNAFVACVHGATAAHDCATAWAQDVAAFLPEDRDRRAAAGMAEYYVGMLREHGGKSAACLREN